MWFRSTRDGGLLLVAHRNAGLWLPPGGHVDPDEHPADTARRELAEELGISRAAARPAFLTVTRDGRLDCGHADVSLWFLAPIAGAPSCAPDTTEFADVRRWAGASWPVAEPQRALPPPGRRVSPSPAGLPAVAPLDRRVRRGHADRAGRPEG